ncbi:hypothetical protein [Leptolyngbya sp. FACHB-261]|uniref:hypothetical protein n=1 Tax=Leptolyngbya sp. FACHB-261 TaxID=2692806 RepID=UPI0016877E5E|nr:hypothetical protein [Leptolyngbya sp. FACHB-261]MBD2104470.1 hypothetical protein [Leptolyngbya sp. FACHB-261]
MNTSHLNPSQTRLMLWDYISRNLNLSPQSKLLLLLIANYTDPRSLKASVPISLLVLQCNLKEPEVNRLLLPLEACHYTERQRVLTDAGRSVILCHLNPQLIQMALRAQL